MFLSQVKLIAAGKVLTGFSLVRTLAMGADVCNSARAMLFALGCIQSHKCNTNTCPTGITTQVLITQVQHQHLPHEHHHTGFERIHPLVITLFSLFLLQMKYMHIQFPDLYHVYYFFKSEILVALSFLFLTTFFLFFFALLEIETFLLTPNFHCVIAWNCCFDHIEAKLIVLSCLKRKRMKMHP